MRLTYVIGYRHRMDRLNNLRKVLEWVSSFSNMDIILVEQDSVPRIDHVNIPGRHIFARNEGPYNRSWAFNIAMRYNQNPIIAFGDSDIIMEPGQFAESVNQLTNHDVVSPYSSILDLTQEENGYSFQNLLSITRPGRGEDDHQKINLCGGLVLFRSEAITKVGGWAENYFVGWGGEDDFQTFKVNRLGLRTKEMPHKAYHFWHPKQDIDTSAYHKMLVQLQQLMQLDDAKLQSHITTTLPKIGMLNKYA
jgi:GT2 family glycosyltransferase